MYICMCIYVNWDVYVCVSMSIGVSVYGELHGLWCQTCVQTTGLTSMNLSFLLCAMGLIMPISQDYCVVLLRSLVPRK